MESEDVANGKNLMDSDKLLEEIAEYFKLESEVEVQINDDGQSVDVMFDRSGYDNSHYANQEFENVENSVKSFIENYNKRNKASLDYSLDDQDDVITIYHTVQEGCRELNEVSDVDVDWNDDDLEDATKKKRRERYEKEDMIYGLKDKDKEKLLYTLINAVGYYCYPLRDNEKVKDFLEDIKLGRFFWDDIPQEIRDSVYTRFTSTEQYERDEENTKDIQKSREEN